MVVPRECAQLRRLQTPQRPPVTRSEGKPRVVETVGMRMVAWMVAAVSLVSLVACRAEPEPGPECPTTVEDALGSPFVTDDTIVGVGYVARYVAAPRAVARGYDVDLRQVAAGDPAPDGVFVRAVEEAPGIGQGDRVLVMGEPGENDRVIVAGECPVLHPLPSGEAQQTATATSPSHTLAALTAAPAGPEAECVNSELGYRLSYPADWFVHPPDVLMAVRPCSLFAREPFQYSPRGPGGSGAEIALTHWAGDCVEFVPTDLPVRSEAVLLARTLGFRVQMSDGEYNYTASLRHGIEPGVYFPSDSGVLPDQPCERTSTLVIATHPAITDRFTETKLVVDRMAATLELVTDGELQGPTASLTPRPAGLPGISIYDVSEIALHAGLPCRTAMDPSHVEHQLVCRSEDSGVTLDLRSGYWAHGYVDFVTASGDSPDERPEATRNLLAAIASLRYDGSDPDAGEEFLMSHYGDDVCRGSNSPCRRTIGSVELHLSSGQDGVYTLYLGPPQ